MIGQEKLYNKILRTLPKSVVLIGDIGSGKTTLAKEIADTLNYNFIHIEENDITTTLEIINLSSKSHTKNLFCFEHGDKLSDQVQNALLKTLEEDTAGNIYFICSADNSRILPTIVSRSDVYNMENYTKEQLEYFSETRCSSTSIEFCINPGDILYKKYLLDIGIYDIILDLCKNIYKNINKANVGNIFNIVRTLEVYEFDKNLAIWVINVLIDFYRTDCNKLRLCMLYKNHISSNSTNFKRTFEQLLVGLNAQ